MSRGSRAGRGRSLLGLPAVVKEFDPLEATLAGEATIATQGQAAEPRAAGMFAGRYQIEQMVGRGGMGTVYRAVDVMVGDVVALKVLDATVTAATNQLEWFRREVRLARPDTTSAGPDQPGGLRRRSTVRIVRSRGRARPAQRPTVSTRCQPSPSGDSLSGRSTSATTTFVPVPETFSHLLP